jgi:hypothetical protein
MYNQSAFVRVAPDFHESEASHSTVLEVVLVLEPRLLCFQLLVTIK